VDDELGSTVDESGQSAAAGTATVEVPAKLQVPQDAPGEELSPPIKAGDDGPSSRSLRLWNTRGKRWVKFSLCATLVVGFGLTAIQWWSAATPPDIPSGFVVPPQDVYLYVTDPNAHVALDAWLSTNDEETFESLCLSILPSAEGATVDWMVMAFPGLDGARDLPVYDGYSIENAPRTEGVVEGSTLETQTSSGGCATPSAYEIGIAHIDRVSQLVGGVFSAHLPRLGDPYAQHERIEVIRETENDQEIIISTPQPIERGSTPTQYPADLAAYPTVLSAAHREAFYQPADLSTSVVLSGGDVWELPNAYRIDSVLPPDYRFEGRDLIWQGGAGLEPSITATSIEADQFRDRYTFLTGIAIGIAASALIACIQEWPGRRKSNDGPQPV
jgi:hypothetical protein